MIGGARNSRNSFGELFILAVLGVLLGVVLIFPEPIFTLLFAGKNPQVSPGATKAVLWLSTTKFGFLFTTLMFVHIQIGVLIFAFSVLLFAFYFHLRHRKRKII